MRHDAAILAAAMRGLDVHAYVCTASDFDDLTVDVVAELFL